MTNSTRGASEHRNLGMIRGAGEAADRGRSDEITLSDLIRVLRRRKQIILTSVIAGFAWHNPVEEFADVYNQSLRRHLGLPEPAMRSQARLNWWIPEPVGESGFGWKF